MSDNAEIKVGGKSYELPIIEGSENEKAIDIGSFRAQSGVITIDSGFKNTGSTTSAITFLDGEKGILRYRGYSIEELAEKYGGKSEMADEFTVSCQRQSSFLIFRTKSKCTP